MILTLPHSHAWQAKSVMVFHIWSVRVVDKCSYFCLQAFDKSAGCYFATHKFALNQISSKS